MKKFTHHNQLGLFIAGRTANWYNLYWNQCGSSFKNLKIGVPLCQATPLLGIYPKDSISYCKDTSTSTNIVALFITVRN